MLKMRNTAQHMETESLLQSLFASKTRLKLLRLFIRNPRRQYYLREISKLLEEPLTPIRRELLNLKEIGFLKRTKVANLIYYDVDSNFLLYQEFKSMIEKTDYARTKRLKDNASAKKEAVTPVVSGQGDRGKEGIFDE